MGAFHNRDSYLGLCKNVTEEVTHMIYFEVFFLIFSISRTIFHMYWGQYSRVLGLKGKYCHYGRERFFLLEHFWGRHDVLL